MSTIYCIGHITHDRIITPTFDRHCPGGTSWYFAWGMQSLISTMPSTEPVPQYRIITSVGPDDLSSIDELVKAGIPVVNIPGPATVYFENKYGENMNNRTQRVLSKAAPFTWDRLEPYLTKDLSSPFKGDREGLGREGLGREGLDLPIFNLGSLLADDFPLDVLKRLHELGTVVADVQGYLRYVDGERVVPTDWPDKQEAFPYIDILKVNEQEMVVLTGFNDPLAAAKKIGEWGVGQVLLTLGDQGSFIYTKADDSVVPIPVYKPKQVVDTTGCGDTYTMGFLFRRAQGASLLDAGSFGAAVSSLKLEHSGPFNSTYQQVLDLVNK